MQLKPPPKPKAYSEIKVTRNPELTHSDSDNSDNHGAVVTHSISEQVTENDNHGAVVTVTVDSDEFEWGELPTTDTRIPLPLNALPEVIANLCESASKSLQVPPDLAFLPALAVLSGASRGRFAVQAKPDHTEKVLALFTAVFMDSGERKSPTLALVDEPLREYEKELVKETSATVKESLQRQSFLERRVKICESKCAKAPDDSELQAEYDEARGELHNFVQAFSPRLIVNDITPEAMTSVMGQNGGNLTQLSGEGGFLKNLAGRYNSGTANLDGANQGYSGEPIRIDRLGRESVTIEPAHLAIGLVVQPHVLSEMKKSGEMKARGLLDRFLFAQPESWQGRRDYENTEPIPARIRAAWNSKVKALVSESTAMLNAGEFRTLTLTPDSFRLHVQWNKETEPRLGHEGDLVPFRGWVSKYSGMVLRIAALFTLLENPHAQEVPEVHMQSAHALWDYWLGQIRYVLGDPVTGSTARVLTAAQKMGTQEFTVREIHTKVQNQNWAKGDTANKIKAELAHLARAGYVRHLPVEGTRSDRWELHPDLIR